MWFNKEQKERYLENCKYEYTTIETIKVLFNMSYEVEARRDNNTDLSNFTEKQIIELFKKFNSKSRVFLQGVASYFFDYYEWCKSENLIYGGLGNPYELKRVRRIIEEIVPQEILNQMFFDNEIFMEYLDDILDVSNKFIAYALYSGINGDKAEEIRKLRITDLHEDKKQVRLCTGRIVNVDDAFIRLMKQTASAEFYYPDGKNQSSQLGYYTYANSEYVLRPCRRGENYSDTPLSREMFYARVRKIREQVGNPYLTAHIIYDNGLINFIKEKCNEDGIDFEDAIFEKGEEGEGREYFYNKQVQEYINEFGSNKTTRLLRMQIKDYMDYI